MTPSSVQNLLKQCSHSAFCVILVFTCNLHELHCSHPCNTAYVYISWLSSVLSAQFTRADQIRFKLLPLILKWKIIIKNCHYIDTHQIIWRREQSHLKRCCVYIEYTIANEYWQHTQSRYFWNIMYLKFTPDSGQC